MKGNERMTISMEKEDDSKGKLIEEGKYEKGVLI